MPRPLWFVNLLKKAFPLRFFMGKIMRRVPGIRKLVYHFFFRGDDMIYLPKDQVIDVNEVLTQPKEMVLPSDVVKHFVEMTDDLWIMHNCICRDATGCEDYPVDLGCLFMGEAIQHINPKLGRRVSREEAIAHIQRARDAGLVHLIGRNRLDTVWLGAGPVGKLLTVCNCCPCCCLWRALPSMPLEISENVSRMPGLRIEVSDRCIGCGTCMQDVCFVDGIYLFDGKAHINADCRGCGRCVEVCPQQAITLTIEDSAYLDLALAHLVELVDVGEASSL
jgi:NAD-dependent dihydropyrimidine dehydrogenase PreA subunit